MAKHWKYYPIEILARGVYVRNGKILLCHTKGADNTYLPGGHVEFLEVAQKALEREVREELGVKARVGRFLGAVEHTFVQKGKRKCEINLVFQMDVSGLTTRHAPESREDYIEFLWWDVSKLGSSRLEPVVLRQMLRPWLKSKGKVERWASAYPAVK